MGRVGLIMAALAAVTVGLSMLIPILGALLVAPLTAAFVGAGAGWWASKVMGYGTAGRGAGAGALAGLGALLGSMIALTVAASILGNNAEFQQGLQQALENAAQENPDAAIPAINAGALATAGGAIGGFCFGIFYLLLSTIGGLIGGVVYGRNRGPAVAAVPGMYPQAGTYPASGAYPTTPADAPTDLPRMTNQPGDQEHGARIYDENDRR
jgi:hypothetical protein